MAVQLMWEYEAAVAVLHKLIKADPALEKRCLAYESTVRLLDRYIADKRVEKRYVVKCDRTFTLVGASMNIATATYSLYDLDAEEFVGMPVTTSRADKTHSVQTPVLLWSCGLRTFCNSVDYLRIYTYERDGKRYVLAPRDADTLDRVRGYQVVIKQRYHGRSRRWEDTTPDGQFRRRAGRGTRNWWSR